MKNMRIATLHSLEKDLAQGTMKDAQDLLDDFLQKEGIIPEHSYHIVENLVSDSSAPVYEALLRDAALGRFDLLLVTPCLFAGRSGDAGDRDLRPAFGSGRK